MSNNKTFEVLSPELQIGFFHRLQTIKSLFFHEALGATVLKVKLEDLDKELNSLVSEEALKKLASFSLRGESVFPVPILLLHNPSLLGYYRLLFGFSQKEFYSKGPFGLFKNMEEKGRLSKTATNDVNELCASLIKTAEIFVEQMNTFSIQTISELQTLTVGPQLRGSHNNVYGRIATEKTFLLIKELVGPYIIRQTLTSIEIKNDSGRVVVIQFASDPDIEIIESLTSGNRLLVSIEIKGGRDISNIHNRVGEAEKSHQKAKLRGYNEFMTIISVDIDYAILKSESPTTSHFFNLERIQDKNNNEFQKFKDILSSIISVQIN